MRDNSPLDPLYTDDPVADGDLTLVPATGALPARPAAAKTAVFYLVAADSITYQIGSAPSGPTITISGADFRVWTEDLGRKTQIFITSRTGTPSFRWV